MRLAFASSVIVRCARVVVRRDGGNAAAIGAAAVLKRVRGGKVLGARLGAACEERRARTVVDRGKRVKVAAARVCAAQVQAAAIVHVGRWMRVRRGRVRAASDGRQADGGHHGRSVIVGGGRVDTANVTAAAIVTPRERPVVGRCRVSAPHQRSNARAVVVSGKRIIHDRRALRTAAANARAIVDACKPSAVEGAHAQTRGQLSGDKCW